MSVRPLLFLRKSLRRFLWRFLLMSVMPLLLF
jgi:hypothetical protein